MLRIDETQPRPFYDTGTNEFVLNGSKNWITNSPIADIFVVWANTAAPDTGKATIKDA
jgi:alkylation response protein AidB-like acyl-CoA dehydrogenase